MTLVAKALHAYAEQSPTKFDRNERAQTVGASEVGQCERKTYWLKNENDPTHGVARDEGFVDTWGARARGTVFEDRFWVPAMRARFGSRLRYAGRYQKTFQKDFLTATPDGLLVNLTPEEQKELRLTRDCTTNCVTVECKTVDPRANLQEAKPENVFQTQVQMGLIRDTTKYRPTHSIISYTDASFWSDVKEFVIEFDPAIYEAAHLRARKIMTGTMQTQEFKPEGWIAGGYECRYCPFTKACGIERRNLPYSDYVTELQIDPQFTAEIRDLALELRRYEEHRDADDARVRLAQEMIKNRLREKGVRRVPGIVTWSPVKGREGFDNKAIQKAAVEAGVDISQFATVGEPTDRLAILIGPKGLVPET